MRTRERARKRRRRADPFPLAEPPGEVVPHSAEWEPPSVEFEPQKPRRGRRRLTPEEQAYREARRAAGRKLGFVSHLVPYAATCLFLMMFSVRAAMIVAFAWGIGVACHGFAAVVAPGLRRRWIGAEVARRVHVDIRRSRRELEGRHARSLEQLSASIAHEIRNPITAAKSLVQQMGEDPGSGDNVEYARVALGELERVERSISHLLRFAREEDLRVEQVEMADVVDSALASFRERVERQAVDLRVDVGEAGSLRGDAEKVRRVVINLVGNALDALYDHPAPTLEIHSGRNLAGDEVWLRVRDNGPGIEADRLERIFSPFQTSKRDGTGLGLAITRKLVEAHDGTIEVTSQPGEGTEFVVTFPEHGAERGAS